jgi:dolichol-phosphate mannosyltransferase
MDVFVIIPAYNEEENIGRLLEDLVNLKPVLETRVIFVDDGSSDGTLRVARTFEARLPMDFILHKPNKGVPQTFYDGLKRASELATSTDAIAIIEGDCTSDLALLPQMVAQLSDGRDLVVASRYIPGGRYKNFPLHRELGSKIVNVVLRLFFYKKGITDYTIFYRAYSARTVKMAFDKYGADLITTKSFAANLEILLKIGEFSRNQGEEPLVYDYGLKKGKSKMRLFKTLFEYRGLILKRLYGSMS